MGIEVDPGRAKELDRAVEADRLRVARFGVHRPAGEPAAGIGGGNGPPMPAGRAAHRLPPAKRSKVARVELRERPRSFPAPPGPPLGGKPRELRLKTCPAGNHPLRHPPGPRPEE